MRLRSVPSTLIVNSSCGGGGSSCDFGAGICCRSEIERDPAALQGPARAEVEPSGAEQDALAGAVGVADEDAGLAVADDPGECEPGAVRRPRRFRLIRAAADERDPAASVRGDGVNVALLRARREAVERDLAVAGRRRAAAGRRRAVAGRLVSPADAMIAPDAASAPTASTTAAAPFLPIWGSFQVDADEPRATALQTG